MRSAEGPPSAARGRGRARGSELAVVVLLAGLVAAIALGAQWGTRSLDVHGHPYVSLYDPPRTRAEAMLVEGDGQAYAALAQDPLLSRPQVFSPAAAGVKPAQEAAYRAGRPLFGWLGWAASLGDRRAVPVVLLALTALGVMVLITGVAVNAGLLGRRMDLSVLAVMLPGSVALFSSTGPEALGTGLALMGLALWYEDRRWLAVAAMSGAVLCRETLVLAPLAIAAVELLRRRARPSLLLPVLVLAAWDVVDRARFGYFPFAAGRGRLSAPWTSMAAVVHWRPIDLVVAAVGVALVARGFRLLPHIHRALLAAYLAMAAVMGPDVWRDWWAFSRPLLPLYAIALLGCLPGRTPLEVPEGVPADRSLQSAVGPASR